MCRPERIAIRIEGIITERRTVLTVPENDLLHAVAIQPVRSILRRQRLIKHEYDIIAIEGDV